LASGFPRGDRYSRGAIAFHWTIAALVLANLTIGILHDSLPRGWQAMGWHRSIGVTVLVLSIGRLGWRLAHRPPPLPAAMPPWERTASKAIHWGFYLLMFVMPLTGWIFSSNPERLRPFSWFGLVNLPMLPVSSGFAVAAKEAHELLGWTMAALVVLHVAAALRHHFLLRDGVLGRMLPGAERRG
jgi:cytochrome b561